MDDTKDQNQNIGNSSLTNANLGNPGTNTTGDATLGVETGETQTNLGADDVSSDTTTASSQMNVNVDDLEQTSVDEKNSTNEVQKIQLENEEESRFAFDQRDDDENFLTEGSTGVDATNKSGIEREGEGSGGNRGDWLEDHEGTAGQKDEGLI